MKPLVILTATVTPQSGSNVTLTEPAKRRAQYQKSAFIWLAQARKLNFDVLIAENSADQLQTWIPTGARGLECTAASSAPRGKGASEADILRQVFFSDSFSLQRRPWVAKCTGRLTVANLSSILPHSGNYTSFVTCRTAPNLSEVDARFVIASPVVWQEHLLAFAEDINDCMGHYLEHALASGLISALAAGVSYLPFRRVPRFRGSSGTSGLKYDSLKMRVAALVEDLANGSLQVGRSQA